MSEENKHENGEIQTVSKGAGLGELMVVPSCSTWPHSRLNFQDCVYEFASRSIVGIPLEGEPRLGVNFLANTAPENVVLVEQVIASLDCKTVEAARIHASEMFKCIGAALMGYEPVNMLNVWSGNFVPKVLAEALVRVGHEYVLHLPAQNARNLSNLNRHGLANLQERHLLLVEGNGDLFAREVNILADVAGERRIPNSINSPFHNKARRAGLVFYSDLDINNVPFTGSTDRRMFPSRFLDNGWDQVEYMKFRHEALHPVQLQKLAAYLLAKAYEAYTDGINVSVAKNLIKEWRYYHNVVQRFYSEMCEVVSGEHIRNTELFRFFEAYCEFKGFRYLGTISSFGRAMAKIHDAPQPRKFPPPKSDRYYMHLRLRPAALRQLQEFMNQKGAADRMCDFDWGEGQ